MDRRDRLRALGYLTAMRVATVVAESAVPVTTLCLLGLVEWLVGAPTVRVGATSVPVTEALAAVVVAEFARRLYALNVADRPD